MNDNNNGYRPQGGQTWNRSHPYYQGGNQGNSFNPNQPSLKDIVFGQAKINEGFNKKTAAYDKAFESLNVKIDSLSSALKDQLSFNEMIETQLAQLVASVPPVENAKAVVTGGGKTTCDPPYPNHVGTKKSTRGDEKLNGEPLGMRDPSQARAPEDREDKPEFIETNLLSFPRRNRKTTVSIHSFRGHD
jgi:hypothetical protein